MSANAVSETSSVRLIKGDIVDLDTEAIVFYAQADLELGSGFGTAISVRGGPSIKKELEGLGPLETGEVAVTSAGNLNSQFIIHAVGPRFQEEDTENKLRATMMNVFRRAEEKGIKSVALPPMGTGFYGVPLDLCARVMAETTQEYLAGDHSIRELIICVMDSREFEPFRESFSALIQEEETVT
jgi:O-acetyl-ADP-ribose deacetylase (regulator of RNase III)